MAAADRLAEVESLLSQQFTVQRFAHILNVSDQSSDLRIQIHPDPRYGGFIGRARIRTVLGLRVPVASIDDVLQGKIWPSKIGRGAAVSARKTADIARMVEAYPHLRSRVPPDVLARLL